MDETLKVLFEQIGNIQFFTLNEKTFKHLSCSKELIFKEFENIRSKILEQIKKIVDYAGVAV